MPGWFSVFGQTEKTKYTLANLSSLHQQLSKVTVVNDRNRAAVVENLRTIAELIIWGDKHDPAFFDFFLEKQVLSIFWRLLAQELTPIPVKVQLLQTLSILIQNIDAGPSVYFILSNNHINELISHRFDFAHEELLAHYVTLLKAIALRLDGNTVQFFIGEAPAPRRGSHPASPVSSPVLGPSHPSSEPPSEQLGVEAAAASTAAGGGRSLSPTRRFALFEEALKLWTHEERA
jgi:hypothetical protein